MADNPSKSAKELRDASKEVQKSTGQIATNLRSASDALTRLGAESIQSFREYNSGITQTINLFSRLGDLAKTRFRDIGTQVNITTGVTQDLVGIIGEAVSATAENFELNSNIEESTKAVKKNLLENASVRAKINEAAKLEYENQEKYISGLDTAYNKKLREVRLKETDSINQDNLVKSLEEELRIANDLLSISTTQEDKTYYSNILAKARISLEDAIVDSKEKQLDLQMASADADSILKQTQTAQLNRYKNIEDAQARVNAAIEQATDSTVKLSIQYKQYGKDVNAIADAQLASGGVLQQFNQMVADKARKEFEDTYKARVKGSKDISKISKDEYDLQFKKETLENSLSKAAESRSKILDRIAKQGGVRTKLDEEELNIVEDIVRESKVQLLGLDESIKKLAVVEKHQKHILHELEQQNIAKHAANEITAGFTNLLGGAGDELLNIGKAIKESMVSPLALVGALIGTALEEFMKLGEANEAFMESSKLNAEQINHLSHFAHDLSLEYRAQGLEYKDVLNSAGALINKFGTMTQVSDVAIEKVSLLGKAFGVSADNAAGVIAQLQRSTGASAETAGNIAALGANFAKAAGVAPDTVMADIANSSEEIATYFKGTEKDLFKTAVEARRLGLDLKTVANISKNLLSFESSIEDQMTASVLLGKEINLDKARQLAMEGKIQEAAEETLKQVGSLSDFNKMNAVQKEAIAKAAGMSVGELQKSLQAQEALSNMTAKDRAEYEAGLKTLNAGNEITGKKLLQEQRNQITQQKIADAVAKIAEIFANVILPVLDPIFKALSGIANVIGWMGPGIMWVVRALLLVKGATLAVQGVAKLISFKRANSELGVMKTLMTNISSFGSKMWKGLLNITGFTSARKALDGLRAAKAADVAITNANTTSTLANTGALNGKKAADLAVRSAALGKLTVVRADTLQSQLNTNAQVTNAAAGSKLGKMISSVGNALKLNTLFKTKDTVETNLNSGAQTRNALANSSIGKIIGKLGSVFRISSAAKNADALATNLNTTAQAASIGPTAAAGTAAGGASFGWAALGLSIAAVGFSIAAVIYSISSLATAFKELKPEQISALKDVLLGLGIGLLTFTGILAALVFSGVLPTAAGGLLAFGGALALVGVGVALTAFGIQMLASAFKELPAENVANLGTALFSLAAGLGAISLASIGFVIALPAILAMTGALMLLTPIFGELGTAIAGLSSGFASLMASIKSMPATELFASAAGFVSLAGALGVFTVASTGILISLPAIMLLTGAMALLGPVLKVVGEGVNYIATGFQNLANAVKQIKPETMWSIAAAFGSVALALGALSVAIVTTAVFAPGAILLADVMLVLGASALMVGFGLKLASSAIESITNSLITLTSSINPSTLTAMKDGLFALAAGIGAVGFAAIGFTIAIPSVTIFSGLMGFLGANLLLVGTGIQSVVTGLNMFVASITTILPMIDQINLLTTAFSDLAASIGEVGLASLLAFPAMAALGAATSIVSSVFGNEEEKSVAASTPGTTAPAAGGTTTTETAGPSIDLSELVSKLDSLISAVNSQPIQLVVNGRVLAEVVGRNTTRSGAVSSK